MFIRLKKIKGNEYAYVVKNKWTKQGPRQVSKKYLGRINELPKIHDDSFSDINFVQNNSTKKILQQLYETELANLGFQMKGKKSMIKDDYLVSLAHFTIKKDNREVVIKTNEGFLCSYMFKKLLRYTPKRDDYETDSRTFAELVVYAGIQIKPEVFVELFKKIYNS